MQEGDSRRGLKKRTAVIEVRFTNVTITRIKYYDKTLPATKDLYAIEAREVTVGVENPIR